MIISFVVPAYMASTTIADTLSSVFGAALPKGWSLDVIVANDGSPDATDVERLIQRDFPEAIFVSQSQNKGKCAAMNLAAPSTRGDVVIILDADDQMVSDWPDRLASILDDWPVAMPLCFSACRTQHGNSTVSTPAYTGPLTFSDLLNERYSGEYLPIFRGEAFRTHGYRDPEMPWGCEMWTYLSMAKQSDLWVSREVMRIYHYDRPGSVTHNRRTSSTSAQIRRCHELILNDFTEDFKALAPRQLQKRLLRVAVYSALSGDRASAWRSWRQGASISEPVESLAAAALVVLGRRSTHLLVGLSKKLKIIKRFG